MGSVKRRMLVNAFLGGLSYLAGMLVSILLTPFLLTRLGDSVYGLIPLINSLVIFLNLFSMGINAALGRYVTYHLVRGEYDEANEYLNTGFVLLGRLAVLGSVPLVVLVLLLPYVFKIPAGYAAEAQWVALIMGVNCLVNIAGSPLTVPLYATQRLALRSSLDIGDVLLRSGLIVAAFLCIRSQVIYVAVAALVSTLAIQLARYLVARALVPRLRLARRFYRRERVRSIFAFSFFMVLSGLGVMLFLRTDLLLVNWLFGSAAVTRYSLASRWSPTIRSMVMTVLSVATPVVTALDAAGDTAKIREMIVRGMRYGLLMAALPCVLFPVFGPQFVETWVGAEYVEVVAPLLVLVLVPIVFVTAGSPTKIALRGMGRVRFPSLVTCTLAPLNVGLSILLATVGGLGMRGIALATLICCFLSSMVIYPIYTARVLRLSPAVYYGGLVRPAISCIPMVLLAVWMSRRVELVGWPRLLGGYAVCSVVYLATAYFVGLRRDDRAMFWQALGAAKPDREGAA